MVADGTVTTGVDDLLEYLKGKDKVAMQDVAAVLGIPLETIQAWVDFLVEEKILGVEYKFTKPYIYLNKEDKSKRQRTAQQSVTIGQIKEEYLTHAREKQVPAEKAFALWRAHVDDALARRQQHFREQALSRRLSNVPLLWERYRSSVLGRS